MELETTVWCPSCKVDKYEVYRKKLRAGVYAHVMEPADAEKKVCKECGENLERHAK